MYGPQTEFSQSIFQEKYCQQGEEIHQAIERVAKGLSDSPQHHSELQDILGKQRFLPGGRIMTAIGAEKDVTAYNCFVSGTIDDSFVEGTGSIVERLKEAATTMRMGGGIGYDFSTLRPTGAFIKKLQSHSSGPISFMKIFSELGICCSSAGHRRGAQMGVMRIDHPNIEEFILSKQPPIEAQGLIEIMHGETDAARKALLFAALQKTLELTGFNISVAITDEFMVALREGTDFWLRFNGHKVKEVSAQGLWEKLMRSTWDWAEPGAIFVDTINKMNNLYYCEKIAATNPCFVGSTKVWTREGPVEFSELADDGGPVEVLTRDDKGRITFRTMFHPRKTNADIPIFEVKLLNGGLICCTKEHLFFLKDLTVKEACNLKQGDILNSVYTGAATQVVSSVIDTGTRQDVYCGTVDETNRFFISIGAESDGVLVHNCGEQPLPPYGACLLGSFNLTKYIVGENTDAPLFNWDQLAQDIPHVVRAMDNVIDRTKYPLREQEYEAQSKRRMGLGVTGLANTLEFIGHPYGSIRFLEVEETLLRFINHHCYMASISLAEEKGAFPLLNNHLHASGRFISKLDDEIVFEVRKHGIRNSHLTSIAPTGTISLAADNVSSSIEPVFAYETERTIRRKDGTVKQIVSDYANRFWASRGRRADDVSVGDHLRVLASAQKYVDSAVSKTCNVGPGVSWDEFKDIYVAAWSAGCKGITTYRMGGMREGILSSVDSDNKAESCKIGEDGRKNCE
jgi:ribonucleotide reductase alpha subunit